MYNYGTPSFWVKSKGSVIFLTFLAWLLALAGPVLSHWLFFRGTVRAVQDIVIGVIPGVFREIIADYALGFSALSVILDLATMLFVAVAGELPSLIIWLILPLSGLLLLLFLLFALWGKYIVARVVLVIKLFLYSGSGLLCYFSMSRVISAIDILGPPLSFTPLVVLFLSALACVLLFATYTTIVNMSTCKLAEA